MVVVTSRGTVATGPASRQPPAVPTPAAIQPSTVPAVAVPPRPQVTGRYAGSVGLVASSEASVNRVMSRLALSHATGSS